MDYNSYMIYEIYFSNQKKIILVKNLHIFENYVGKNSHKLFYYSENLLTLQDFLLAKNNNEKKRKIYV